MREESAKSARVRAETAPTPTLYKNITISEKSAKQPQISNYVTQDEYDPPENHTNYITQDDNYPTAKNTQDKVHNTRLLTQ